MFFGGEGELAGLKMSWWKLPWLKVSGWVLSVLEISELELLSYELPVGYFSGSSCSG